MSTRWPTWLADQAAARDTAGLTRRLQPRGPHDPVIDLAGNDYLGLSRNAKVVRAAAEATIRWGAGAGASRLVSGTLDLHRELENELAAHLGQPAALVFSTGYQANLGAVTALADRETVVVSDAHVHASLVDAARLSRAEIVVTEHGDVSAVEEGLSHAGGRRALVLAESVYSVLGDAAPLVELALVCERHGALLLVDEAHALGVVGTRGEGLLSHLGLAGAEHVVVTATLSKALGAQGGAVLGPAAVVDHLVNRSRPFIFDTALAPAAAGAALASLRELAARPELAALVRRRVTHLAERLGVTRPEGAVLSVPMPSPRHAVAAQAACLTAGVRVGCFRPPSVPDGVSRLRITASAGPSDDTWAAAVAVVTEIARRHQ